MSSLKNISRITINPDICHGKPTIRGLRYPVENMLELLASGMTSDEILADYPDLVYEDVLACIAINDILSWLASGMTHEEILNDYPELKEEHILAALWYAAKRESVIRIITA
jgi:uncharacterized protein (DUF433 family)